MPSTPSVTRREVLAAAVAAGALGGDAVAQESDSGSDGATPTAGEGDWLSFQDGPHNAGHAPSARGPVDDGEVAWSRRLGPAGFSAPAVVDGTVYVGTLDGTVVALSADEGTTRWEFATEGDVVSSPAVSDLHLYVGSTDGRVYALRRPDGAERWSFETGEAVQSSPAIARVEVPEGDATTSATRTQQETEAASTGGGDRVAEKRVFVGSDDGTLYALSADDGAVRWAYEVGPPVSSPAIRVRDDERTDGDERSGSEPRVYVGDSEGGVYALSAVDGSELWTVELGGEVAAPTVAGDDVYAAAGDAGLYALSAADGTRKWHFEHGPARSPAVAGDRLYVAVEDGGVYALSTLDGVEQWHADFGGDPGPPAVAGGGSGDSADEAGSGDSADEAGSGDSADEAGTSDSSAGPGGTVYVTQSGGVIVRALSAADGDQRWAAELQGKRGSAPAVVDETLYLNAGTVAAIDEVGRTPSPTVAHTPWDGRAVLESWAPTYLTWLGASVGVPAVLGALVYALGRFGRGDRSGGLLSGGDRTDESRGSPGSGPDDGSAGRGSDDDAPGRGSDDDAPGRGSDDDAAS